MFYALGHISRYFAEGSFMVGINEVDGENGESVSSLVKYGAVERPDGGIAVTIMNK